MARNSDRFPSQDIFAVLDTLIEIGNPVPASTIYLAFGSDIQRYEIARRFMVELELVTLVSDQIAITEKGRLAIERAKEMVRIGQV